MSGQHFTWQKELVNGTNSDTGFFTPGTVLINDAFNHDSLKQVSALSRPLMLVISFTYTTPRFKADGAGLQSPLLAGARLGDWRSSEIISGAVIVDASLPQQSSYSARPRTGKQSRHLRGGNTFWNRNPSQPLF